MFNCSNRFLDRNTSSSIRNDDKSTNMAYVVAAGRRPGEGDRPPRAGLHLTLCTRMRKPEVLCTVKYITVLSVLYKALVRVAQEVIIKGVP